MDITQQVIERVADYKEIPVEGITPEATIEELEMDSLDALNLIFELEEEFDLTIPDDDAFEMKTIADMVKGIEELVAEKKAKDSEDKSEPEEKDE